MALTPDLCLSKTSGTILVRQLYDTGMTEVFHPLLVRFSTTISTTNDTIDTNAPTMLMTTPTRLPMCYHD